MGVKTAGKQRNTDGRWSRVIVFAVIPVLAMALAAVAGYLKWQDASIRESDSWAAQSVRVATEDTIAMLSYHPETVDKELTTARDRMTGNFRDAYLRLINEVVIPGAKQKRVTAVATVPAAASVSVTENRAVVMVFVNQTTTIGNDPPTDTVSTVRVTLDKVNERWLVSQFQPI
ncbi:hypothetical protein AWC29_29370 [Mycobacterium triplex]|uniref:Mce associated membrane protein n=1 Tax=Mycobacterium triplex TaxID=47839 RepID=A0ABX3VX97_9MYCO|nr:hypothetical protein AWC29_29370 [Mycobacterium triplex]